MDAQSGEPAIRRLVGTTREVVEFCAALPGPVRVAYEVGPTGLGRARAPAQAALECVVAAPGKITRPATDRIKTDRRDAARGLIADDRRATPDARPWLVEEALRDPVRAREDVRGDHDARAAPSERA